MTKKFIKRWILCVVLNISYCKTVMLLIMLPWFQIKRLRLHQSLVMDGANSVQGPQMGPGLQFGHLWCDVCLSVWFRRHMRLCEELKEAGQNEPWTTGTPQLHDPTHSFITKKMMTTNHVSFWSSISIFKMCFLFRLQRFNLFIFTQQDYIMKLQDLICQPTPILSSSAVKAEFLCAWDEFICSAPAEHAKVAPKIFLRVHIYVPSWNVEGVDKTVFYKKAFLCIWCYACLKRVCLQRQVYQ